MIKIVDCTLRDGGYYNSWKFSNTFINEYLKTLNINKIDFIELGYLSLNKKIFPDYVNSNLISNLKNINHAKCMFMINFNDFKKINNHDKLSFYKKVNENKFISKIRIAINFSDIHLLDENIHKLKRKKFFINVIGINKDNLKKSLSLINKNIKLLNTFYGIYIADSFGSFDLEDIDIISKNLKKIKIPIGFHGHDNQGDALQNSIHAIKRNFKFIDCTVSGMGRGAGNAKLEELLLKFNYDPKNTYALLELNKFIKKFITPYKKKYHWGTNLFYFLSSKWNIHPSYVQSMLIKREFTDEQIIKTLNILKNLKSTKYDVKFFSLIKNLNKGFIGKNNLYDLNINSNKNFIIIGAGFKNKEIINMILKSQNKYNILSINKEMIEGIKNSILVSIHPYRLINSSNKNSLVITSLALLKYFNILNKTKIFDIGIKNSENIYANSNCINIPNLQTLTYALGIASFFKPKKIILFGVSGINTDPESYLEEKKTLHNFIKLNNNIEIKSLSKNNYDIQIIKTL